MTIQVFDDLIEQTRNGNVHSAARQYAELMELPLAECIETMTNIRKVLLGKKRVRSANELREPDYDLELLEMEQETE